jgi:dTDP-4-dehydrorhamnose 3,5-epimerase
MIFRSLDLAGSYLIEPEPNRDERGLFARTFCERELGEHGLVSRFAQSSTSYTRARGTVRGMHFSEPQETKLIRCTAGAVHDVIVDLRSDSPTYLKAVAQELSAQSRAALYVPAGLAHGFQTLTDDAELLYMIDRPYEAGAARGVRWDDPSLHISWPEPITLISRRDLAFADWQA